MGLANGSCQHRFPAYLSCRG